MACLKYIKIDNIDIEFPILPASLVGGCSISKPNLHVQRVEATSNKSQGGSQIGTGEFCHRFSVKVSLSNNPISKELKETFLILKQELQTGTLTTNTHACSCKKAYPASGFGLI